MDQDLEEAFQTITGKTHTIAEITPLAGGSINDAAKIRSNGEWYFVKWNRSGLYPGMFELEVKGLATIAKTNALRTPEVIGHISIRDKAYLFLEYIPHGRSDARYFKHLGEELAALHQSSSSFSGLEYNNYIGSLEQQNCISDSWTSFFIDFRLSPLIEKARNARLLDASTIEQFNRLFKVLPGLLPREESSLLHGDLWSGNCFPDINGHPVVIDPAIYYGNREMDLAMTKLFGGFPPVFYESYNSAFPLQAGWEQRIALHNLYPLLVHLNLFGKGYLTDILQTLRRYTG